MSNIWHVNDNLSSPRDSFWTHLQKLSDYQSEKDYASIRGLYSNIVSDRMLAEVIESDIKSGVINMYESGYVELKGVVAFANSNGGMNSAGQ